MLDAAIQLLAVRLEGEETLKYHCVCPLITLTTMDACKCDFCVSVCKTNFEDHHTPDTIHSFRDSILVWKMYDCYCTIVV